MGDIRCWDYIVINGKDCETMIKRVVVVASILLVVLCSISALRLGLDSLFEKLYDGTIRDIHVYRNKPAWELASAVRRQNRRAIERIAKDRPELLNYQDPKYGATLLLWAVGMEKYESAEALLKCGADPNIASIPDGMTPLYLAAGFSWVDHNAEKDPRYVKLLLRYGANPNKNYIGRKYSNPIEYDGSERFSPLMASIRCGIEKTKALVEAGADINYKLPTGKTAAVMALQCGGPNSILEALEYAHYLIVEKKANISDYYHPSMVCPGDDPNRKLFPVSIMRTWTYPLDSQRYRIKMEIVKEFVRQGVNYRNAKIDKYTLSEIKHRYPDTWKDYIKKY